MALFFFLPAIFHYICIRKSYPNRQSDADHSKLNGCQPITKNKVNSLTILISSRYIPFAELRNMFGR